jgi:hypothetical protein
MKESIRTQFLTNTEDTGRHIITSTRTGKTYFIEPIGMDRPADWGSVNPATGDMMVKKGWGKNRGSVDKNESLITEENGFEKIHEIGPGESPYSKIEELDSKYPSK